MDASARRSGGGLWEGLYRVVMRRNSIYVTFVIAGAFVGERVRFFPVYLLYFFVVWIEIRLLGFFGFRLVL